MIDRDKVSPEVARKLTVGLFTSLNAQLSATSQSQPQESVSDNEKAWLAAEKGQQ